MNNGQDHLCSLRAKKKKDFNHFILILGTFYADSTYLWNFVYSHDDMYVQYIDTNVY